MMVASRIQPISPRDGRIPVWKFRNYPWGVDDAMLERQTPVRVNHLLYGVWVET